MDTKEQKIDTTWTNKETLEGKPPIASPGSSFSEDLIDPFEQAKNKTFSPAQPKTEPIGKPNIEEPHIQPRPTPVLETETKQEPAEPITPKQITAQKIVPPFTQPETKPEIQPEEEKKQSPLLKTVLKIIVIFIGLGLFIYLFLNFPAYFAKAKYLFSLSKNSTSKEVLSGPLKEIQNSNSSSSDLFLPFVQQALETPTSNLAEAVSQTSTGGGLTLADIADNTAIIPKINIKAPIIWNSPPDETSMLANLQNGIAHYSGTSLPGTGKGPIFITGHSSYYWWDKGKYKTVFANLDKLESGDEIGIGYNNKVYVYKVYEKIVVKPEQTEVLNPVDEPILALMTCVPVGTNLKRLIVHAKQIETTQSTIPQQKETPSTSPQSGSSQPTNAQPSSSDNLNLLPWL